VITTQEFDPWVRWLYESELACIPEDNLGTSWASCGCVLLAAAVTSARSAISLSGFTGFPEEFTALVVEVMELVDVWSHPLFRRLEKLVQNPAADSAEIKSVFESAAGELWNKASRLALELEKARNYRVLGGGRQDWVDDGELCLLLEQLEEQYSIDDLGAF
jgi:hypothetical protein